MVDRLARDLQRAFPGVGGLSAQNLWRMRAFFLAYTEEVTILLQPVREFDGRTLPKPMSNLPSGHNYSLRDTTKPIGKVSSQLRRDALPEPLRGSLPFVDQLEVELGRVRPEAEET